MRSMPSSAILYLLLGACLSGCSVGACMGERTRDISWLAPGVARTQVAGELGEPLSNRRDSLWRNQDQYNVATGTTNSAAGLAGRLALDVLTLGLWEVLGPEAELGADRRVWTRAFVYYDEDDGIDTVMPLPLALDPYESM